MYWKERSIYNVMSGRSRRDKMLRPIHIFLLSQRYVFVDRFLSLKGDTIHKLSVRHLWSNHIWTTMYQFYSDIQNKHKRNILAVRLYISKSLEVDIILWAFVNRFIMYLKTTQRTNDPLVLCDWVKFLSYRVPIH